MNMETKGKAINPILLLEALGVIVVLWIVYAIMKKLHLIGSSEADKIHDAQDKQNAIDAGTLDASSALKTISIANFSKTGVGPSELKNQNPISAKQMADYAIQIYDSKGVFHDTESKVIGAIAAMPNKFSVSVLSSAFNTAYGRDLLEYLKTFMNDEQLASVARSIKDKPDFSRFLTATTKYLKDNKLTLTL